MGGGASKPKVSTTAETSRSSVSHSEHSHSGKHSHHSEHSHSEGHSNKHKHSDGHSDKHSHSDHHSDKHHHGEGHSDKHHHGEGHSDKHHHGEGHHKIDPSAALIQAHMGVTSHHVGHDVNDVKRSTHAHKETDSVSSKLHAMDQMFANPHLHDDGGVRHRSVRDDDDSIIQHDYTTGDLNEHHIRDIKHMQTYDGINLVHTSTHDGNKLHRALDESVSEQDLENYIAKHGVPDTKFHTRHRHSKLHDHTLDRHQTAGEL